VLDDTVADKNFSFKVNWYSNNTKGMHMRSYKRSGALHACR
jgi:hypothetical protein